MAGLKCRACGEPLPPSLVCLVCEYEQMTGHVLERIPDRPVLEDVELVQLFEFDQAAPESETERYEQAMSNGFVA